MHVIYVRTTLNGHVKIWDQTIHQSREVKIVWDVHWLFVDGNRHWKLTLENSCASSSYAQCHHPQPQSLVEIERGELLWHRVMLPIDFDFSSLDASLQKIVAWERHLLEHTPLSHHFHGRVETSSFTAMEYECQS